MAERREGEPRRWLVVRRSRGAGLASRGGGDGNGAFSNGFGSKNEKRVWSFGQMENRPRKRFAKPCSLGPPFLGHEDDERIVL
jgi:hypothetical protein